VTDIQETYGGIPYSHFAYQYDPGDRLTQSGYTFYTPTEVHNEAFTYDGNGNRLTRIWDGSSETYTYDQNNRLLSMTTPLGFPTTYAYDNNGNLLSKTAGSVTTQYVYDKENRLARVITPLSGEVEYLYSALGHQLSRRTVTDTSYYVNDFGDRMFELNALGIPEAMYTHGPGPDEPISMDQGGASCFFHQDRLYNVRFITDQSKGIQATHDYYAFGTLARQSGTLIQPYGFNGSEFDQTSGLNRYRTVHYTPAEGRYNSTSTFFNPYTFAWDNPSTYVNPGGFNPPIGINRSSKGRLIVLDRTNPKQRNANINYGVTYNGTTQRASVWQVSGSVPYGFQYETYAGGDLNLRVFGDATTKFDIPVYIETRNNVNTSVYAVVEGVVMSASGELDKKGTYHVGDIYVDVIHKSFSDHGGTIIGTYDPGSTVEYNGITAEIPSYVAVPGLEYYYDYYSSITTQPPPAMASGGGSGGQTDMGKIQFTVAYAEKDVQMEYNVETKINPGNHNAGKGGHLYIYTRANSDSRNIYVGVKGTVTATLNLEMYNSSSYYKICAGALVEGVYVSGCTSGKTDNKIAKNATFDESPSGETYMGQGFWPYMKELTGVESSVDSPYQRGYGLW